MLHRRPTVRPLFVPTLLLAFLVTPSAPLRAQDNPFLPPASAAPAAAKNASAGYEFVGMTEVGRDTLLSFTHLADKHSVWVPVGKTVNDITVVSYDPKTDTAIIKAENQTLTLTLRKGAVVAGSANPASAAAFNVATPQNLAAIPPLPPVVVPTKPMNQQEEKEMEARMLVTDLLEIGVQQRKAYEEAQRQAAQRAADPKMPAAPSAQPAKR